jgi:hypothetical protein
MSSNQTLLIHKTDLTRTQLHTQADTPLQGGDIRLRINHFAFTSNNITYAAFGEAMSYWQFFPVPSGTDSSWGIIPVWGFADVLESRADGVDVGERFYGYFPMADSVVLHASKTSPQGFVDLRPHRAELAAVYNSYTRCSQDAFYQTNNEALQCLLRPLYITSWLIDDFFADNAFFGARKLLLTSASSKTAYGTAYALQQRKAEHPELEVIGLTSEANRAFVQSLGCYHRVLTYDELDAIAPDAPCALIDFAGSAKLRQSIHERFTELKYDCAIGGTHVSELGSGKGLPGPKPILFFAPAQIKKRVQEWGGAEFQKRMVASWHEFAAQVTEQEWLKVHTHRGDAAVQAAYAQVLAGRGDARAGHVLSLLPA